MPQIKLTYIFMLSNRGHFIHLFTLIQIRQFFNNFYELLTEISIEVMPKKKVGKYILNMDDLLGCGQFGKVFRAQDQETKQLVAIKVIEKKTIIQDKYTQNALVREIEISRNLKSPNIIQCYEVHETSNNIYIIQELANNGTLLDMLTQRKMFPEPEALLFIMEILNGFVNLVENGIIHRDVKSSNILVKDKVMKLADFGFAKCTKNLTFMNSVVGTPAYMAPQVLSREHFEKYGHKCDVWSFGCVCFQILFGRLPWKIQSHNIKELFEEIKQQSIKGVAYPEEPHVSDQMKDLISGCLRYEEKDRFDWIQILNHEVFKNENIGKIDQTSSISTNFAISRLRLSIHCQNISLNKMLKQMPDPLHKDEIINILKAIDQEMSQEEALEIFSSITKSQDLTQKEFKEYMKEHDIKLSGLKSAKMAKKQSENEEESEIQILIQSLAKTMQSKELDIYDLFRKYDISKNNRLNEQQFCHLILSIDNSISKKHLSELFQAFDTNKTKQINFNTCYSNLCKMIQVVNVKDEQMRKSLKKITSRKQ